MCYDHFRNISQFFTHIRRKVRHQTKHYHNIYRTLYSYYENNFPVSNSQFFYENRNVRDTFPSPILSTHLTLLFLQTTREDLNFA